MVMKGGIFYRYFRLVDSTGMAIPGARIYLRDEYLDPEDSPVTTTDNEGLFRVYARADKLGRPGRYTRQLIRQIDISGKSVPWDLSQTTFSVIVHDLEYERELSTVNTIEAGVSLGPQLRGFGHTLWAATVGIKGGASAACSLVYERGSNGDFLHLQRRFSGEVGPKLEFGAKLREVGFMVGATAEGAATGYWWDDFRIADPLGANKKVAEDFIAAFWWDKLRAERLLIFPLIGPLLECIGSFLYSEYNFSSYLFETGTGSGFHVSGEAGLKWGFKGTHVRASIMGVEGEAYGAIEHCASNIAGDKRTTALADFGLGVNLGVGLEFTKAWARRIDAKRSWVQCTYSTVRREMDS